MNFTTRIVLGLLFCLLPGAVGCSYPKVSTTAYQSATALYSVCNQRDDDRLEAVAASIQSSLLAGELTNAEAQWLLRIVEMARRDEWTDAAAESRKLMSDQVEEI